MDVWALHLKVQQLILSILNDIPGVWQKWGPAFLERCFPSPIFCFFWLFITVELVLAFDIYTQIISTCNKKPSISYPRLIPEGSQRAGGDPGQFRVCLDSWGICLKWFMLAADSHINAFLEELEQGHCATKKQGVWPHVILQKKNPKKNRTQS